MIRKNNILETLHFEKSPIRAILNEDETVVWLCLNDLVKALDRGIMMDNGQAMRLCRTAIRIPFKDGGRNRWGVKPYDVYNLLRAIRTENGRVAKVCARIQEWINGLPVEMVSKAPIKMPEQTLEPIIFNYQDKFPITFKASNGETMINATQMARSFGKQPTEWLRLASTIELRKALVRRGESPSLESQIMTTRGHMGATWIDESLAMEFARWLSPDFSVWCNNCIQELVTKGHVSVSYDQPEHRSTFAEAVGNYPVPQNFEDALMLAAQQAKKIREYEPKVAFYDEYVENRDWFRTSRIADELDISVRQLNQFLAEEQILKFDGKRWVVHTHYQALQCDVPYMWEREGKYYPTGSVRRWTQAGREYVIELWNSKYSIGK